MALALGSSQVMALDLGKVQVKSALGQPLLAEIPLHPANPAELQNLTVQLASSEEFARAGIVGGRTSIPLHFTVANAGTGQPVIRITSSVAINDPFLDLLLEVNGSVGKSVREFAILLDPPSQAPVTTRVANAQPQNRASVTAAPAKPPVAARPAVTPSPKVTGGKFGPVQQGDTLSSIAHSTTPAGVEFNQMLLALKQANPDAFYRDNINALKSGAVLRIPTSAEAQAMTIAAAAEEVRRQNGDWRAGTPSKPTVVADTATRASSNDSNSHENTQSGDRLALVPAKENAGSGSQGGDKSSSSVRQDLMRAQESLASMQAQSTDLKSRVKDLADINANNEHLLSLKDNQIAELQAQLAAARKAANLPPAEPLAAANPAAATSTAATDPGVKAAAGDLATATASTSADAEETPVAASSSSMAPASLAAASSSAAVKAPAIVAKQPEPVKPVAKAPVKPVAVVEQPWYMQTWAWAAGAGAVAVLVLLALLGRKRKPVAKSGSSLADRFDAASPSEQDIIGADDVDQDELLDQLAEHPDDIYLHLELVTLYYSRRDVEHFEAAAEAMYAHITDANQDEWQDVLHMGEDLVPEHPLFDHRGDSSDNSIDDAQGDFDIDNYQNEAAESTMTSSQPKKVSEYNFNFDLTKQPGASNAGQDDDADDATVISPVGGHTADTTDGDEPASSWKFNEIAEADDAGASEQLVGIDEYNDDPVDTKLDLARAYLDMGDSDGARAMLGEALREGSQVQQDTARRLLDGIS